MTQHLHYEFSDVKMNILYLDYAGFFSMQLVLIDFMLRVCIFRIRRRRKKVIILFKELKRPFLQNNLPY